MKATVYQSKQGDRELEGICEAAARAQDVQARQRLAAQEIAIIDGEIADLTAENERLRAELEKLDSAVYRPRAV